MRALVVYESMFGNTEAVAHAVADGLSTRADVAVVEVGDAAGHVDDEVDLLVIGGPTHAFSMSRKRTRQDAATKTTGPLVSRRIGIREWLDELRPTGAMAATFDTKVHNPRLPGSAARAAQRRLRRLGARITSPAMTFYVGGVDGPLLDGELERARQWAADLVRSASERAPADGDGRPAPQHRLPNGPRRRAS